MSNDLLERFRPDEVASELELSRSRSGASFYLEHHDAFVEVPCPGCRASEGLKWRFRKFGFSHVECASCATLFVNPRPSELLLAKFYREHASPVRWSAVVKATNQVRKIWQHLPRVERLKEAVGDCRAGTKECVDLGAGIGTFTQALAEDGAYERVVAVDLSPDCVATCQENGLEAREGSAKDLESESVDAIVSNDLIEHLFDPQEFLADCYRALSADGLLMITTPNGQGFDFRVLGEQTENVVPPEHLQYFNPGSLRLAVERTGFEVVAVTTPGRLDVQLVKRKFLRGDVDLRDNRFLIELFELNDEELEKDFQKMLSQNRLSSHLEIIAQKNHQVSIL